ncbi:PLP-dependent aminotransferase family protein [Parahaliea mediterranea]|uniref:aminotransferase-like domain-containing protein n=1 Tax=Parahaliea mediterranea TaxID=651086 RepID=UPI000E2FB126|nr:PLP-dependent aminotransferase family protein [Parahaliea mediterranea]
MSQGLKALFAERAGSGEPFVFPGPDVPIVFNFDQGLAAPETFPIDQLLRLSRKIFDEDGSSPLDYFDPQVGYEELVYGSRRLREALARRYCLKHRQGMAASNFILTSGSVQGIALAAAAFINPGDTVIVEAASFPYAISYFEAAGANIVCVPVDEHGMDVDAVERVASEVTRQGQKLKLVYTISTFQMPTGVVMSLERRERLLALAETFDFIVHEDYVYGELRFEGQALPSLLSLDTRGRVIHDNSFSKTLAPGLRIGWMTGDEAMINAMASVRQDLGVSQWMARLAQAFLDEGLFDEHLDNVNAIYRQKRDVAIEAVQKHCANYLKFRKPEGSFYLWLEVDQRVDWERAAHLAAQEGIFFRPGERFETAGDGRRFIRLAYGRVSHEVIEGGIAKLGDILDRCARDCA